MIPGLIDGARARAPLESECDVAVVGSGPAGAMVARELAASGARVVTLEEGPYVEPGEFVEDAFGSMAMLYRQMGCSVTMGRVPTPYLQGRVVGGTSVVNGAISWRLPRDVWQEWVEADPGLAEALPWEELERWFDRIEGELGIAPTDPEVAGPNNLLLARGAEALGLEHRPIRRNVRGCRGLGRCLQGCPEGHKVSMARSYLPEAGRAGAALICGARVDELLCERGRCVGVRGRLEGGAWFRVRARRAVVLAASAVQTPALLERNGLGTRQVGRGFMCHPGVSVIGEFDAPVQAWRGATQGHEVVGLRAEGIKFEALGYDLGLCAARLKGAGRGWAEALEGVGRWAHWGAAIRSRARGRVRASGRVGARVRWAMAPQDVRLVRRAVGVLGEMMLAAGAERVCPGVAGWDEEVRERGRMRALVREGPLEASAYDRVITHMFGTCRMGTDPAASVVGPDFGCHGVEGLYVADSSVFPGNTGVNPQTSILALAALCARRIVERG